MNLSGLREEEGQTADGLAGTGVWSGWAVVSDGWYAEDLDGENMAPQKLSRFSAFSNQISSN
jgi:hypothetical protein